jgi:hypothetical protein
MSQPPDYRLRLFLSADLAGSTAFKAGPGEQPVQAESPQAQWVLITREFYREFPRLIQQHYQADLRGISADLNTKYPKTWKTVGDEILFCCRIHDTYHLCLCIQAFIKAIRDHAATLDAAGGHLDLKGCAWVAAFPTPNVTVSIGDGRKTADQFDEEFERQADDMTERVDFLGNGIDSGFRVAQHCATDKFALCAELAWILAAAAEKGLFHGQFVYAGRHILKGVIKNRPYPIVAINTERKPSRKRVRESELDLLNTTDLSPRKLFKFLTDFMEDEKIELPYLPDLGLPGILSQLPARYAKHRELWIKEADIERSRQRLEESGALAPEEKENGEIPTAVIQGAEAMTKEQAE